MRESIDSTSGTKGIMRYAEEMLPEVDHWLVTEGLIELGALVCNKVAACEICPLQQECQAHRLQLDLPIRAQRKPITQLYRTVGVIECDNHFYLLKGEQNKVMADLYEFPFVEGEEFMQRLEAKTGLSLTYVRPLEKVVHHFTRFKAELTPHLLRASAKVGENWFAKEQLKKLPFSAGHRKIIQEVLE